MFSNPCLPVLPLRRVRGARLVFVLGLALTGACDDGGDGGGGDRDGGADSGGGHVVLDTPSELASFLEGKTLTMEGDAIPSHPRGFDEDRNLGAATQCYQRITVSVSASNWNLVEDRGTLDGAPSVGDTGTCDHATSSGQLSFTSTSASFENVTATCFDVDLTFPGGGSQEGRGVISRDGKTASLELYYENQAEGHRCANGAVGAATVQVQGAPFTGDAVQVFTIE